MQESVRAQRALWSSMSRLKGTGAVLRGSWRDSDAPQRDCFGKLRVQTRRSQWTRLDTRPAAACVSRGTNIGVDGMLSMEAESLAGSSCLGLLPSEDHEGMHRHRHRAALRSRPWRGPSRVGAEKRRCSWIVHKY